MLKNLTSRWPDILVAIIGGLGTTAITALAIWLLSDQSEGFFGWMELPESLPRWAVLVGATALLCWGIYFALKLWGLLRGKKISEDAMDVLSLMGDSHPESVTDRYLSAHLKMSKIKVSAVLVELSESDLVIRELGGGSFAGERGYSLTDKGIRLAGEDA